MHQQNLLFEVHGGSHGIQPKLVGADTVHSQKHHQCVHALLVLISEKKLANFHRRLGCMRDCLIFPFERDFINSFAYHSRYNLFSHFFCFLYINSGMSMDSIGNITQLRPILKWISLFKKISDKVDVLPITFNSRGTKIWKKTFEKNSQMPEMVVGTCCLIKAGYMVTLVGCRLAGTVMEKVTGAFGQEQWAHNAQKRQRSKMGTDSWTDGQSGV